MVHEAGRRAAAAPAGERRIDFGIQGMSCASCVATIEGALGGTPGVISGGVNLATNAATVNFVPATVSLADLRRAIREAGYEPLEMAEGASLADHEKAAREREIRTLRRKLTVGMVLTVPILLGSMHHW